MSERVEQVPVMCDNGHFYLTIRGQITVDPGFKSTLKGPIRYEVPCPACGAGGLIEPGIYGAPASFRQRLRIAGRVLRTGYAG